MSPEMKKRLAARAITNRAADAKVEYLNSPEYAAKVAQHNAAVRRELNQFAAEVFRVAGVDPAEFARERGIRFKSGL